MTHAALYTPEDYLWVGHPDGIMKIIDSARLGELYDSNVAPKNETEQLLADNREWLRIYLTHAIGTYVITIPPGGPLPKWDRMWLESVDRQR